jgi:regulation of enolase protein 1 (concanavalin A-like superfamily)
MPLLLFSACSHQPKPVVNATPKPSPATMVSGIKVETPVNVSFSTWSKDWPVEWQWVDPAEVKSPTPHDTRAAVLRVRIPSGKDMRPGNTTAPRFVKALTGDFQIEAGVRFSPKENYQGAGLLIYLDDRNFVRFERAYGGQGGGGEGMRLSASRAGEMRVVTTPADIPTEDPDVQLRLVRSGSIVTAFWREDEAAEWRPAGEVQFDLPETVRAGLIVCNTAREISAEFTYIKLLPTGS